MFTQDGSDGSRPAVDFRSCDVDCRLGPLAKLQRMTKMLKSIHRYLFFPETNDYTFVYVMSFCLMNMMYMIYMIYMRYMNCTSTVYELFMNCI